MLPEPDVLLAAATSVDPATYERMLDLEWPRGPAGSTQLRLSLDTFRPWTSRLSEGKLAFGANREVV